MHQWTNFNFSKFHSWYYDMFSFKLICCYNVAFTLQLFFPTPTLKASGLVLIHVCSSVYVLSFSYCVHWIMLCLLTYALHVCLWFLYYVPFVLRDIGWWKWIMRFGCWVKVNESVWIIMLLTCNYLNEITCHYLNPSLNEVKCNVYPLSEVDILDSLQFWLFKNI